MLSKLRYRWYYPKCFRWQLPRDYSLFLWVFPPHWPRAWWGRRLWVWRPNGLLCAILTLGPLEFTLSYPASSRLARSR